MADDIDRAQDYAERFTADALREHYRRTTPLSPLLNQEGGADRWGEVCEDCGEAIPAARQKAMPGCCRCITCQQEFEAIRCSNWRAL